MDEVLTCEALKKENKTKMYIHLKSLACMCVYFYIFPL